MERYLRQIILPEIGEIGQRKITQTSVLIVGVGGLGSAVTTYLCAAGIGRIGLADADTVSLSNLQRQVLYNEQEIGKSKTEMAKHHLSQLNSTIQIDTYPVFLDKKNIKSIVNQYDIIVDASDNFPCRFLINDACVQLGKPFVYGAISNLQGQLSVFNVDNNSATYQCLFPDEATLLALPRKTIPVLGILPGVIGCMQAGEVLKWAVGYGKLLKNTLCCLNLSDNTTAHFAVAPTEEGRKMSLQTILG